MKIRRPAVFFVFLALVLFFGLDCEVMGMELTPGDVEKLKTASLTDRLIVVLPKSGKSVHVEVYAFEKKNAVWKERIRTDGFVGFNGIWKTTFEGAGRTPAGVYSFGRAFGTEADPGSLKPYTKLTGNDFWVDDPDSKYYNQWVGGDVADRDWKSAEDMSKEVIAYKYAVAIDYNVNPVVRGAGSAIFLHCSKGKPTAGCVAVPEAVMIELLKFIDDHTRIVIAESPEHLLTF